MDKYLLYDETLNIKDYYTIDQIIEKIKKNPSNKYYKYINNNEILINNKLVCNTLFIAHRINKLEEVNNIPNIFGVEIDLRDNYLNNELILSHDPFNNGENFEDYIKNFQNKTIILNIKSERIEIRCLELLKKYNIIDYFFLDSSFPMIYLLNTKYSENNIACRFSEFEPINNYLINSNMTKWVWVDCFTKQPLTYDIYNKIKELNGKICIVSPELQGQIEKIEIYKKYFDDNNIFPNAICCKIYNIIKWI